MFSKQDQSRNEFMLDGSFVYRGYDWWWHSFTGRNAKTGEEKPFFVEFFLCNPELGGAEPVLGQLPANQEAGIKPSYLMIKAGCWGKDHKQLHRFIAWDDVRIKTKRQFAVNAFDCHCSETRLTGSIAVSEEEAKAHPEYMCDAGSMKWDLMLDKQIAFNVGYGASWLFRKLKAFEMYWHAEGMKTKYAGTIELDGELYLITPDTSYGYADKNWGRNFTSPWVWLSSNCMTSNITGEKLTNSVFDIGGGRPKVFFMPLNRKLLGGFYYEGKEYDYNFSKFWTKPRTRFKSWEDETYVYWKVWQENHHSLMKTVARCKKEDMLLVNYESPDGKKRHNKLWNGGNGTGRIMLYEKEQGALRLVDDIRVTHIGCEYGEYDR